MKYRLALCQMMVVSDKSENLRRAESMLTEAAAAKADLLVLPEVFNAPYQADLFPRYAESYPGPSTEFLSLTARKLNTPIIGGSIVEKAVDGKIYNTSYVFDAKGDLIAKHRKVHLFDVDMPGQITFKESDTLSPGENITLVNLGPLKAGLMICYDIRFPEMSRALGQEGADIIIVPAAFNLTSGPLFWELVMRCRAVDQQLFVAAAAPARNNNASYQSWGHSLVIDPWGKIIAAADEKEQIVFADIDLTEKDRFRNEVPVLKHYRSDMYKVSYCTVGNGLEYTQTHDEKKEDK